MRPTPRLLLLLLCALPSAACRETGGTRRFDLAEEPDAAKPRDLAAPDLAARDLTVPAGADLTDLPPDLVTPPPPPDLSGQPNPVLLVVQVGDGIAALSNSSAPVTLRKFKADGSEVMAGKFPLALPVAANGMQQPITVAGSATSEGQLSRSADGRYAVLAGYASAPGVAMIVATMSMSVNRVIARIDAAGNVDTTTGFTMAYDTGNIRSATSDNGTRFWAAGTTGNAAAGGVEFIAFGQQGPGTQILAMPNNCRVVHLFGGQLYLASGASNFTTVMSVGAGLPTMPGQMANIGAGLATMGGSPYSFAVLDLDGKVAGADTIYLADDRAAASMGGIQKWTFDGMSWKLATTITGGLGTGVRGLCAVAGGGQVLLFATTTEANANTLIAVADDGNNKATVIATAPMNTAFRGVIVAP